MGYVVGGQAIEEVVLCQCECRHVARMRSTSHQVRCAHDNPQPMLACRHCSENSGGKFRDADTAAHRFVDVFGDGVVMARQWDVAIAAQLEQPVAIALCVALLHVLPRSYHLREVFVAPALIALRVYAKSLHIHPLALARRVIHQRYQTHRGIVQKRLGDLQHIVASQFAANMQQVLSSQEPVVTSVT